MKEKRQVPTTQISRARERELSPPGGDTVSLDRAVPLFPIHERIRAEAATAPLPMQLRGGTAVECREWQETFRGKLLELLQHPRPPARWHVIREAEADCDDHVREEWVLVGEGADPVPLHVLRPTKGSGPWPAVLCVHGHGPHGHDAVAGKEDDPQVAAAIAGSNYDYARQLAREGFLTAAPCLTPFGRRLGDRTGYRDQDPCAVTFVRLQLLGRVLMAENLRDLLWTVAYLQSRPDVIGERLGCVGLSYGGRMTMLLAAVAPQVKVAVISGALNVMQERVMQHYGCGAQVIPGLLRYGDVPEIASLIAPRPCLWEVGASDSLIDAAWAEIALERIRRAYAALDAQDHLSVARFEGGHRWHGIEAVRLLRSSLMRGAAVAGA
jgi:dienelactone hydrolase